MHPSRLMSKQLCSRLAPYGAALRKRTSMSCAMSLRNQPHLFSTSLLLPARLISATSPQPPIQIEQGDRKFRIVSSTPSDGSSSTNTNPDASARLEEISPKAASAASFSFAEFGRSVPILNMFRKEYLLRVAHKGFSRYLYFTTASSVCSMFAMSIGSHALLSAFFVDSSPSIWLLKDLAPTLVTVAVASRVSSFDKYRRFWYISSMCLTQVSVGLEFLAPLAITSVLGAVSAATDAAAAVEQQAGLLTPSNCLLVTAAFTSFLRGVGMLMIGITRTSIIEHFSRNRNAGELAKTISSLQMLLYTFSGALGLGFASNVSSVELRAAAVVVASAASIVCSYLSVKHLGTRVLTLHIVLRQLQKFVDSNFTSVYTPDEFATLSGVWEVVPYINKPRSVEHTQDSAEQAQHAYINRIHDFSNSLTFTSSLQDFSSGNSVASLRGALEADMREGQKVNQTNRCVVFPVSKNAVDNKPNNITAFFYEACHDDNTENRIKIGVQKLKAEECVKAVVAACDQLHRLEKSPEQTSTPPLLLMEHAREQVPVVDHFFLLLKRAGWYTDTHAIINERKG